MRRHCVCLLNRIHEHASAQPVRAQICDGGFCEFSFDIVFGQLLGAVCVQVRVILLRQWTGRGAIRQKLTIRHYSMRFHIELVASIKQALWARSAN